MPKMTGFEMLEHLGKEKVCLNTPKVIFTTEFIADGENSDFLTEKGKELGVSCWCVKPFVDDSKRSHFITVLEALINRK